MKVILALLLLFALPAFAAEPPHLIVVISVDQLRPDYLERFQPWLSERGFNRFLQAGAVFTNARYPHAVTFTGPGHATLGSGLTASEHGIVGNAWYERDAGFDAKKWEWFFDDSGGYEPSPRPNHPPRKEGEKPWYALGGGSPRYCAYDDRVAVTAGTTSGMSPVAMGEDTLGDRIKQKYPEARVMSVAIKDRAATLMAGRRADAAYWFDYRLPGFVSSTYYRFNPALFDFNKSVAGYIPGSKKWRPLANVPAAELKKVTFDPPEAWPLKNDRYGTSFDHPIDDFRALTYTPFANDMLADFAMGIVLGEELGTRAQPDVLFISFSSPDYIGHYYGPDSLEVADDFLRLDRTLERLIDNLTRRTPPGKLLVALTADHGVQANPDVAKLRNPKADTGRVDMRNAVADARTIAELPPLRIDIERALAKKLEVPFSTKAPLSKALVFFFEEPYLYLNWPRIAELKLDGERVKRALRDVIASMKSRGFDRAFTNTELIAPRANVSETERLVRNAFRADRSGDIYLVLRPGWIWTWGTNSTTHGQPVDADRHVPLMFWGEMVKEGKYEAPASPTDLARTIGSLLGVEAGGKTSNVLPVF